MKIILSIIFTLYFTTAYTQTISDTIYWSSCYKLKWKDFQSNIDTTSAYGAVSNPIINYKLRATEDTFTIEVTCFFIKSKSWSKFKNSDTLLIHEQGHFDIAELFARKLRKAFYEYKFNYKTVSTDIEKIFKLNKQERKKADILYDKETDFSKNRKQQILWNIKIKKELEALIKFYKKSD